MNNIVASFDKNFILEHITNKFKDLQAYSLYLINPLTYRIIKEVKKFKKFDEKEFSQFKKYEIEKPYYILNMQKCHINDNVNRVVHPIKYNNAFIYVWSTSYVKDFSFNALKDTDFGSHLLYNKKNIFAFINHDNKFFSDRQLNFSSEKFDGSKELIKGNIYEVNLRLKKMKIAGHV